MNKLLFLLLLTTFSACSLQTVESQSKIDEKSSAVAKTKQPVLVELFTSQG
jgi:hypothetical protein